MLVEGHGTRQEIFEYLRQYVLSQAASIDTLSARECDFILTRCFPLLLGFEQDIPVLTALQTRYHQRQMALPPLPASAVPNLEVNARLTQINDFFDPTTIEPNTWTRFKNWLNPALTHFSFMPRYFLLRGGLLILTLNLLSLAIQGFTLLNAVVLPLIVSAMLGSYLEPYFVNLYRHFTGEDRLLVLQADSVIPEILRQNEALLQSRALDTQSVVPVNEADFESLRLEFTQKNALLTRVRAYIAQSTPAETNRFAMAIRERFLALAACLEAQHTAMETRCSTLIDTYLQTVAEVRYAQTIVEGALQENMSPVQEAALVRFFEVHATEAQQQALRRELDPLLHILAQLDNHYFSTPITRPPLPFELPYGTTAPSAPHIYKYQTFNTLRTAPPDQKTALKGLLDLLSLAPEAPDFVTVCTQLLEAYRGNGITLEAIQAPIQAYLFQTCTGFAPKSLAAFSESQRTVIATAYAASAPEIEAMLRGITQSLHHGHHPLSHSTEVILHLMGLCQVAAHLRDPALPCPELLRLQSILNDYLDRFDGAVMFEENQLALLDVLRSLLPREVADKVMADLAQKRLIYLLTHYQQAALTGPSRPALEGRSADPLADIREGAFLAEDLLFLLRVEANSLAHGTNPLLETFTTFILNNPDSTPAALAFQLQALAAAAAAGILPQAALSAFQYLAITAAPRTAESTLDPQMPLALVSYNTEGTTEGTVVPATMTLAHFVETFENTCPVTAAAAQALVAQAPANNSAALTSFIAQVSGTTAEQAKSLLASLANQLLGGTLSDEQKARCFSSLAEPFTLLLDQEPAYFATLRPELRRVLASDLDIAKKLMAARAFTLEEIWQDYLPQPPLFIESLIYLLLDPSVCMRYPLSPDILAHLRQSREEDAAVALGQFLEGCTGFNSTRLRDKPFLFAANRNGYLTTLVLSASPDRLLAWKSFFKHRPNNPEAQAYIKARWIAYARDLATRAPSFENMVLLLEEIQLRLGRAPADLSTFIRHQPFQDIFDILAAHEHVLKAPSLFSKYFKTLAAFSEGIVDDGVANIQGLFGTRPTPDPHKEVIRSALAKLSMPFKNFQFDAQAFNTHYNAAIHGPIWVSLNQSSYSPHTSLIILFRAVFDPLFQNQQQEANAILRQQQATHQRALTAAPTEPTAPHHALSPRRSAL